MKIQAAVISDQHLEFSSYAAYPDLCGDSYFALEQQVNFAIKHSADLLMLGDTFEKNHPDSFSLSQAFQQIEKMAEASLPVLFIQGNHDYSRRKPWLSLQPWSFHMHKQVKPVGALMVYGLDYQPISSLPREMASIPAVASVLMCHQAWAELMGTHLPSDGSLVELVPDNISLVLTGDYHVHKRLELINKNGHPFTVLSPGSSSMQSLAEDANKSFFVLSDSVDSVPLLTRPVERVELVSEIQGRKAMLDLQTSLISHEENQALPPHIRSPIWHVKVHPALMGLLTDELTRVSRKRAHLFIRPLSSCEFSQPEKPAGESSFEEALQKVLAEHGDLKDTAIRLWRSADLKREIESIVQERLNEVNC